MDSTTRTLVLTLSLSLVACACAGDATGDATGDGREPGANSSADGGADEGQGRAGASADPDAGDECGAVNAFGECTGKPGPSDPPVTVHDAGHKYEAAVWDCSCIRFITVEDAQRYRAHDFTLDAIGKKGVKERTCADTLEGAIARAEPACDEGADGRCVCETCCPIPAGGLDVATCTDDAPGECPADRLCPDQPAECAP